MSILKSLIKLNNKLESSWQIVDFRQPPVVVPAGWYVAEFTMPGSLEHVPSLLIRDHNQIEHERALSGVHSGRNRMLFFLPAGQLIAHTETIVFERLAKVSSLEARFRTLLICARYLRDFFGFNALFKTIALQFQAPYERSTSLLTFYSQDVSQREYLANIESWERFKGFGKGIINVFGGKAKIAVVIEFESQRKALENMLIQPDWVLLADADTSLPADADYCVILRKTECLRSPAILMLKRAIRKANTRPKLIYTDHDYVNGLDAANDCNVEGSAEPSHQPTLLPVFKPQASRCYLACFNYIGPAVVYATELVREYGLLDLMSEAQCYQIAFDAFADEASVLHVPEALFSSSAQTSPVTPPPLTPSSPWKGIQWERHLDYNRLVADKKASQEPSVDLIIPTRDGLAVLKPCVDSILTKTEYSNFSIIIVDNGSVQPETFDYFRSIEQDTRVKVVNYPGEFNYSAINNFAAAQGESPYLALVNNDVEVINGNWLTQMMAWVQQPEVGIVGAKLLFGDGRVQHAGVTVGMGNAAGHIHRLENGDAPGYQMRCLATQNMMAVTAACLVTPRDVFEQMNGLNEEAFKVAYNDIDYCLRVEESGKHVIWTPEAILYHHESVSRGDDMSDTHIERYFSELKELQRRWKTKGFVDKFYSPHLRISDEGVYPQVTSESHQAMRYLE